MAIGGFAIAVGNSIPELSTNLLSCLTDKPEMVGFGFGAIVGSGVFGKARKDNFHGCYEN